MTLQLIQPQEIEVFYIIPTIRKYFAKYMKDSKYSQKKISELLQIRESTVSQYVNEKRGNQVIFPRKVELALKKGAMSIKNHGDLIHETQKILTLIRKTGALCSIHKKMSKVPKDCDIARCMP